MKTVDYIRESCEMQNATRPEDYIGMACAYEYAVWEIYSRNKRLHMNILADLITRVHQATWVPFRSQPATFPNGRMANPHSTIKESLFRLFDAYEDGRLEPIQLYHLFEEIHPWHDGNGRVGSLLYNLAAGTITNPTHPEPHPSWSR